VNAVNKFMNPAGYCVFLLALALPALAQTNLGTITFTNKSGTVVSNAVVTKSDGVKLTYRLEGGGGTVRLADLPGELQTRFGYSMEATINADTVNRIRENAFRRQQATAAAAAGEEMRKQLRRKKVEASLVVILARVIQRLGDTLLVDCSGQGGGRGWAGYGHTPEYDKLVAAKGVEKLRAYETERGTILLIDFPGVANVADEDGFMIVAYPCGTYEYTAVSGGKKTVRKYTCSLDRAVEYERLLFPRRGDTGDVVVRGII